MTIQEAIDLFVANAAYTDAAGAKLYVQAIRILLVRRPSSTTIDGQKVDFSVGFLRDELARANQVIDAETAKNTNSGLVRVYDLSTIRD